MLTTTSTRYMYSHNIITVNRRATCRNCQQFCHLHVIWEMAWILCIPYSRKLSREKTFTNFVVLEPPAKVFSLKFGCAILTYSCTLGFSIPRKFSPRNGHTYQSAKVFSLESFPLYGIYEHDIYMHLHEYTD